MSATDQAATGGTSEIPPAIANDPSAPEPTDPNVVVAAGAEQGDGMDIDEQPATKAAESTSVIGADTITQPANPTTVIPQQPTAPDVFSTIQPPPPPSVPAPSSQTVASAPMTNVTLATSAAGVVERPTIARTGYIYDMLMMLHCHDGYTPTNENRSSGDGHPEEPMRIKRIFMHLKEAGLIARMKKLEFAEVTAEQVMQVHSEDHWQKVQGTEDLTDELIEESKQYYESLSLYVCRETAHCARLSCGGVIQACASVCKGEVRNAFAIVRPPGHHAEPNEHMGFCFYNNVAVAAKEMQRLGLAKKVLILDWDVHHGNGTQRAFWNDPSVLYMSIHRHDGGKFYPSSDFGALDMVGEGAGVGTSVNIPWPGPGFGDADYLYAFQKIIMPIAYEFAPDLVIISAGFDAAKGDDLGQCLVTPAAYAHMTHMLCATAGGKVVVALEGGYDLTAISISATAVAQVLLGETPEELPALQASEVATEVMYQVAQVQSKYWTSIDIKGCEPPEVKDTEESSVRTSIPDLLKAHRAYHLYEKHGLYQIPLASEALQASFGGQVACSPNVYEVKDNDVLVVFVHDFGNLRVETDGVTTTNIHMTNSYLLDTSSRVIDWVTSSGYAMIDINILMALPTHLVRGSKSLIEKAPSQQGRLLRYIWDNYIELSASENVVFIGHGTGCMAIMELINTRSVQEKVKAVVQVAGLHSLVRIDPTTAERGTWFRSCSRVYLPKAHPLLLEDRVHRKVGGQVRTPEGAEKVVDVLNAALPEIKEFVAFLVTPPAPTSAAVAPAQTSTPAPNGEAEAPTSAHADGQANGDTNVTVVGTQGEASMDIDEPSAAGTTAADQDMEQAAAPVPVAPSATAIST